MSVSSVNSMLSMLAPTGARPASPGPSTSGTVEAAAARSPFADQLADQLRKIEELKARARSNVEGEQGKTAPEEQIASLVKEEMRRMLEEAAARKMQAGAGAQAVLINIKV